MNSFYSEDELKQIGFRSIGKNVLISRKSSLYSANNISVGDNVRIDDFCILSGKVELGSFIHIAAYTALYGSDAGIYISDFANLSSRVCVYAVSDDYSGESMTNPMIDDKYKMITQAPVYIEKHVIVGSTSVILPGVTLKEGSAFGAFSLIDHDPEPWSINAGIPFKKIKDRSKKLLDKELQFNNERHIDNGK